MTPSSIENYYKGGDSGDEFDIMYGKSYKELLTTVHNHILGFTFIFAIICYLISLTSIKESLKRFLIIEPFISIIVTFGSMFLIKYVHGSFSYLMIFSSTIMYLTFFVSIAYIYRECKK